MKSKWFEVHGTLHRGIDIETIRELNGERFRWTWASVTVLIVALALAIGICRELAIACGL